MKLEPASERFVHRLGLAAGLLMAALAVAVLLTQSFSWNNLALLFAGVVVIAQSTVSLRPVKNK